MIQASGSECDRTFERLAPFVADEVVRIEGDEIIIDNDAKPLARAVAACFDPYAPEQARFASPAV